MTHRVIIISSPERVPAEISKVVTLFKAGLRQFHIRKPDFDDFDMINFITSIPQQYYKHIVLHSHYYLVKEFGLKGIQVGKDRIDEGRQFKDSCQYYGYSAHSFNEIVALKGEYSHFFLSPVFDSISKSNYKAAFYPEELQEFLLSKPDLNVIALGGVTEVNKQQAYDFGFKGVAALGAVWKADNIKKQFIELVKDTTQRPYVLSIAGFDPSSGAGVTADIKTFEMNKVMGLGVTTAITYQNESEFISVDWLNFTQLEKQLDVLLKKYSPVFVKIGLIENFNVLAQLISKLKEKIPGVKIIWDPVLSASAGFIFHDKTDQEKIHSILQNIYLVTPNIPEARQLFGKTIPAEIQKELDTNNCAVLLKGGHSEGDEATDFLIEEQVITTFSSSRIANNTKHGTGCVLSSAITAGLASGQSLKVAIRNAKNYTLRIIESNKGLLGYHSPEK